MPKVVTPPNLAALVAQISSDYPHLEVVEGNQFAWHAQKQRLAYRTTGRDTIKDIFSLLHELGHAVLDHIDYTYDIELLQLEVAAWEKARELSVRYATELDEDHIQDCLDTYRDWLHLRATCPTCFARSFQTSASSYRCFNCQTEWSVTRSRLCRPYRLKTNQVTYTP